MGQKNLRQSTKMTFTNLQMKCLLLGQNLVSKPPLQAQEASQGEGDDRDLQPIEQSAQGRGSCPCQRRKTVLIQ